MKKISFTLIFMLSVLANTYGQWTSNIIGQMPESFALGITVAAGRNDGVERIYATTETQIWEWTYNAGTWTSTQVASGLTADLQSITSGDGRNDGMTRLYYTDWADGGSVYEATWNGSSWTTLWIGSCPGGTHSSGITLGAGRNDGVNRLFTMGSYGVYEYSWTGSAWSAAIVVANNWSETSGFVGDSRNDGVDRLIFNASCHHEANWNGSSYGSPITIGSCSSSYSADAVEIADGRNDGVNRVYVNTELAGRIEYSWNGSAYTSTTVRALGQRGDIHVAPLHADQLNRVYMTHSSNFPVAAGDLLEYTWNSGTNQWDSTDVLLYAISGATSYIEAGVGRNDNIMRLYAPNFSTGEIYELTAANPNNLCGSLSSTSSIVNANCTAANGSVTLTGTGGIAPYTYQWGANAGNQTTATITGLTSGSYSCDITDAAGCSITVVQTVAVITSSIATNGTIVNAACGTPNGSITLAPSGGQAPYTYQWDANAGNQTTATASNLSAGAYVVTITDANGCIHIETIGVSNIGGPSLSPSQTNLLCFGATTGSASVSASGGTAPYTYLWDDFGASTTSSISGLSAGSYAVIVTDASGCQSVQTFTISSPNAISINTVVTESTFLTGGAIDATVTGGTPPYSFSWSNGSTSEDISNLAAGSYTLTVTDANSCTNLITETINETASLVDQEEVRFMIYPNPAQSLVRISIEQQLTGELLIYNLSGVKVFSQSIENSKNLEIDLADFTNGVYIICLNSGENNAIKRLVIAK